MVKTATSKSQRRNRFQSFFTPHRVLVGLVGIAAIVAIISIGIIAVPKIASLFNRPQTQAQAHKSLQDISTQLNFPGTLVYEKITDQGCGPNPTTWLSLKDVCSQTLYKYYKASGSAETNLRTADGIIVREGWEGYNNADGAGRFEHVVTSREATSLTYLYPKSAKPSILLGFFPRDDPRYSDETTQQFFALDQDIPLTGDEYVYGVQVVTGYGK